MRRSLRTFALLCALLPQCLLATLAPALVMCQEADGAQVLELALSDCCETVGLDSDTDEPGAREQGADCAGCADSALPFSLKHDDLQQPILLTLALQHETPAWAWKACGPPARLLSSKPVPDRALQALGTINLRC